MVLKQDETIQTLLLMLRVVQQDIRRQKFQEHQILIGISMCVVEKFLVQALLLQLSSGTLVACMVQEVLLPLARDR